MLGCATTTDFSIDNSLDALVKKLFEAPRTPQQSMLYAVSDNDPDMRREAIAQVATSDDAQSEWAMKGFVAVALLESDPQTRCVAIRALGRSRDPRAVDTCIKIINSADYPPADVRPPDAVARWDATDVLAVFALEGKLDAAQRGVVRDILLDRLANDRERHVRVAAAYGLGAYRERGVLEALIAALRDEDFAVAGACETSLVALTGETHACNAREWEAWLKSSGGDPFARAGQVPESRRKPYDGRWSRAWYETKEFFRWLYPGSKG